MIEIEPWYLIPIFECKLACQSRSKVRVVEGRKSRKLIVFEKVLKKGVGGLLRPYFGPRDAPAMPTGCPRDAPGMPPGCPRNESCFKDPGLPTPYLNVTQNIKANRVDLQHYH